MDRRLSMNDRTSAIPFSTRNEGGFPKKTESQKEFQNSNATLEILGKLAISQNLNNWFTFLVTYDDAKNRQ